MDYKKRLEGVYTDNSFAFFHDGPIVRGSTQVHSFRIPNDITNIREVFVTYNQRETVYTSEVIDNKVTLSEVDTFKFKANEETTVQLKIATETEYIVSPIFYIEVEKGLDELQKTYDDDFYAIDITVNKQSIRALSYLPEAVNDTYLKCKFTFDSTWNGKQKIVYFKDEFNHLIKTSLSYNWCLIPTIILSNPGIINIGVYSDVSRSTIWSNDINVAAGLLRLPDIDSESTLADKLNVEISRAKEAEKLLTDNLNAEVQRATMAESTLDTKITDEITKVNSVNAEIVSNLTQEVNRATEAENQIATNLTNEISRATTKETDIDNRLASEISSRNTGDTNLQTQIDAINSRSDVVDVVASKAELLAYDKDITIDDIIKVLQDESQENSTAYYRNIAEIKPYNWQLVGILSQYYTKARVDTLISAETSARENADNVVTTSINNVRADLNYEIIRAKGAENKISSDLASEISRAEGIETALGNTLTNEVNRAKEVEATLSEKIDDEISRAKTKENELNTRLENVESTKLDKVSTANKVYGTDGTGAQTTYDVSKLGQVDDVTYNSKSLVSNRVANLNGFLTYSDEELS